MKQLFEYLEHHETLRRESLNLVVSENRSSPAVRKMMASDLGNRYSDALYGGTKFVRKIISFCEEVIKELFHAKHAIVTPISGTIAVISAVMGLTPLKGKVLKMPSIAGGFPLDLRAFHRKEVNFPANYDNFSIKLEETLEFIQSSSFDLIMFGQSLFLFPSPVRPILEALNGRIPSVYDGSHVLGLIAGKQFQDPFFEGIDVLVGSTHKTFFGPQGGVILVNNDSVLKPVEKYGGFEIRGSGHVLIDNMHVHRVGALSVAALEFIKFGEAYAKQVIKNSKQLAKSLDAEGLAVRGKSRGFTASHQIILNYEMGVARKYKEQLEALGIFIDGEARIGTSEVTRMGMKESEMKEVAKIIADVVFERTAADEIQKEVRNLVDHFQVLQYCFDDEELEHFVKK